MSDHDALAQEMQEALGLRANPIFDTCADIAMSHIKAAYKQGWDDREADILERADSMGLPNDVSKARTQALEEVISHLEEHGHQYAANRIRDLAESAAPEGKKS